MRPRKNSGRRWRRVLGLTGGIGSGKSLVLDEFKKKGAFTLDADAIVRELLEKDKAVHSAIDKRFGRKAFDSNGRVNKKALALEIFRRPRSRKALERILHPRVRARIWEALRRHRGDVAVLDIPLLYESKWEGKLDGVIVVNASRKNRLARLKRRGMEGAEARRRMKVQISLATKARRADFLIDNNGSIAETKRQVAKIWETLPRKTRRT